MIAKAFESYLDNDEIVIFASGVSDSSNVKPGAFLREINLLNKTIASQKGKLLVYFSTCSIYDPSMNNSAYVQHKLKVEELIEKHQSSFIIFRLSNPIGNTQNTHTIVNYFINSILNKKKIEVWKNASRNIIDMDHVYLACKEIIQSKQYVNSIINIANPKNYPVNFILETIENYFNTKGKYIIQDKGAGPLIDIANVQPIFTKFNINFDEHYLPVLLQKYFPNK